ncbi:hypothetical protein HMPREF1486_05550 [Streptomyces sp. HPH0547]|nr:hypothetical protein HMPREF1486_05550 [Streptomyces sp. HPH0547]
MGCGPSLFKVCAVAQSGSTQPVTRTMSACGPF